MCSSTSKSHWVILLHMTPIVSDEVLRDVLRWFERIVTICVAVRVHDVSNNIFLAHITQNAVANVFSRRRNAFFGCRLSLVSIDFFVSFVNGLVWRVFVVALCGFTRWRQCELVDLYGILYSFFVVCYRAWRYFDCSEWTVCRGIRFLYKSVASPCPAEAVNGSRSLYTYCPSVNENGALRTFQSYSLFYRRSNVFIRLSTSVLIVNCR